MKRGSGLITVVFVAVSSLFLSLGFGRKLGAAPSGVSAPDQYYLAGFAKKEMSPSAAEIAQGTVHLGGNGLGTTATGIHDPLYARAMVLTEAGGTNPFATVILDSTGVSNRVIHRIQAAVSQRTPIPADHVFVGATHTHSGPDLQGLWHGVSGDYRAQIVNQATAAVVDAYNGSEPAYLFASLGQADSKNRRGWDMTDKDITVLSAREVSTGRHLGTVVNFAAHPNINPIGASLLSADFCGYLSDKIEAELGGTAVYVNGIVGDVVPPRIDATYEVTRDYGESMAQRAIDSMAKPTQISPATIEVKASSWRQKIGNGIFMTAKYLNMLDYDLINNGLFNFQIDTQASYFRLGDTAQGVIFPGESLTRNGLPIKAAMKSPFKLFLGLTGDTLGYFVPWDEFWKGRNNNYEELISIEDHVADSTRDRLIQSVSSGNQEF